MYFPTSFRIHAVVVNPFCNKELSPAFLEKQFRDACQTPGSLHENLTFHVDYNTSIDAGSKYVQRMLLEYRQQHPGPVIGIIECPKLQDIKEAVHALDDFPFVTIRLLVGKRQLVEQACSVVLHQHNGSMKEFHLLDMRMCHWETLNLIGFFLLLMCSFQGHCMINSSPRSKLHDPALHRLLHNVMKKVFALMLAEFRKLGANVIFANFSKIIVYIGKVDLSSACAYCDSLLKTLQTR